MTLTLKPVEENFAAEVFDAPLDRPLDTSTVEEIKSAMDRYGVLAFRRDRPITDEAHLAFGRCFGPLQKIQMLTMIGKSKTRLSSLELIDVGNLDQDGNILAFDDRRRMYQQGNLLWHSDVTFDDNRATYSILAGHVVPPSGADTEFADMRAAYDALPEAMKKRIDGLVAEHSVWYSRALMGLTDVTDEEKATRPPAQHPLVHVHPGSKRKTLYLASHASHIVGWPVDEGRALLKELTEFATQRQFVYCHKWQAGDLVMWDNMATMHRGTPFDDGKYPRDMRRVTVLEREMTLATG